MSLSVRIPLLLAILLLSWEVQGWSQITTTPRNPSPYRFKENTLAFRNETVWEYEDGKRVQASSDPKEKKYVHRCYVMSRSTVQFWKFARFEPKSPRLSARQLEERVRQICRKDVWKAPLTDNQRWVIPGYSNLYELSTHESEVLKKSLGLAWPAFFRTGNVLAVIRPSPENQQETHEKISQTLKEHRPVIIWLYNFPKIDLHHIVVLYRQKPNKNTYLAYDPNEPTSPCELTFDPETNAFNLPKTSYFEGGPVSVRPIYTNIFF
jgi:hypothetical protein